MDGLAAVAAEGDVPGVDRAQADVDRLEAGRGRDVPGTGQGPPPERVEIGGFVALGAVPLELGKGHVEERHGLRSPRPRFIHTAYC